MRKEKTIRDKLDKMLLGKYAKFNTKEIGVLFWVIGLDDSIRKGIKRAHQLTKEEQSNA